MTAAEDRIRRLASAKKEWAAIKAAASAGVPRPESPNFDSIQKEHEMRKNGQTIKAAASSRRAKQQVTYTIGGKPQVLKNRTYTLGYMAASVIGGKGATEKLRAALAKQGVDSPETTAWEVEVEGVKVGAFLGASVATIVVDPKAEAIERAAVRALNGEDIPAKPSGKKLAKAKAPARRKVADPKPTRKTPVRKAAASRKAVA